MCFYLGSLVEIVSHESFMILFEEWRLFESNDEIDELDLHIFVFMFSGLYLFLFKYDL